MFVRLLLIATIIPLQSCSNTTIGEQLKNSFDINLSENSSIPEPITKVKVEKKSSEIKKVKLVKNQNQNQIKNDINKGEIINENVLSNKNRFNKKATKPIKKVIFNPQPYRIILRLSGANPSAPAETVTEALRKAGVQFEVEKIERFDQENFPRNTSLKR